MQLEKFLFCEMARNEANGQISLIGLHPGDLMTIERQRDAPREFVIPNLSCVVVLGDMDGVRNIRFQCQVRYGNTEVLNTPEQLMALPVPRRFCNIMIGFSPFPCLQGIGDYEFRLAVQPERQPPMTFSRKFRIESNAPATVTH